MRICDECVNYFLECAVSNSLLRHGLCELCGKEAYCYDIAIPENKKKTGNNIDNAADSIREAIRVLYYPDIAKNDGLQLADYTIVKKSGKSPEEFVKYVLKKEVKENDKKTSVWW
jgi:hypothetical protein